MPIKAVQQFMLGTVLNNEQQAKEMDVSNAELMQSKYFG